jgi:hypothetical protein
MERRGAKRIASTSLTGLRGFTQETKNLKVRDDELVRSAVVMIYADVHKANILTYIT